MFCAASGVAGREAVGEGEMTKACSQKCGGKAGGKRKYHKQNTRIADCKTSWASEPCSILLVARCLCALLNDFVLSQLSASQRIEYIGRMPRLSVSILTYRAFSFATSPSHSSFYNMPVSQPGKSPSTTRPDTVKAGPSSPPPSPPLRSVSPDEKPLSSTDPRDIDYRIHPELYKVLRGEMNVFKTQPYSNELKVLWRFKDEATARRSSAELYEKFEGFR